MPLRLNGVCFVYQCSVTCGNGLQVRSFSCPEKNKCDPKAKPAPEQSCYPGDCIAWITGPWNEVCLLKQYQQLF